jgi:hypothetical protein
MYDSTWETLLRIGRNAQNGGHGVMSTGERLAAALLLNRPDWIAADGFTLAGAVERLGTDWLSRIPQVARQLEDEQEASSAAAYAEAERLRIAKIAAVAPAAEGDPPRFDAAFVSHGSAPGYRDVEIVVDLTPEQDGVESLRAVLRFDSADAARVARAVQDVHSVAWRNGDPLDLKPGETKPRWLPAQ